MMALNRRQSAGHTYLIWLAAVLAVFAILTILILTILAFDKFPSTSFLEHPNFQKVANKIINNEITEDSEISVILLQNHVDTTALYTEVMKTMLGFLVGIIVSMLILLGAQMYMWSRDRKILEQWRESGFVCERLEFLSANRLKINNIELELNKTQIENLSKIAKSRKLGKPIHALDISDHGGQSIKRLREELGAKFIERILIKMRKREGYWLEVDSSKIHGLPEQLFSPATNVEALVAGLFLSTQVHMQKLSDIRDPTPCYNKLYPLRIFAMLLIVIFFWVVKNK